VPAFVPTPAAACAASCTGPTLPCRASAETALLRSGMRLMGFVADFPRQETFSSRDIAGSLSVLPNRCGHRPSDHLFVAFTAAQCGPRSDAGLAECHRHATSDALVPPPAPRISSPPVQSAGSPVRYKRANRHRRCSHRRLHCPAQRAAGRCRSNRLQGWQPLCDALGAISRVTALQQITAWSAKPRLLVARRWAPRRGQV
jgi:hypothetical protein